MPKTIDVNIDIDVDYKSVEDLKSEIKALEAEFETLSVGSDKWKELGSQIKAAKTQLKDIELQFEALDAEQRGAAIVDSFRGVVGIFEAAGGALAALGIESEELENIEKRVLGLAVAANGLRDLSDGIIGFKKVLPGIQDSISELGNSIKSSFTTATGAVNGFKVALTSIGIGLVIGLVYSLVQAQEELAEKLKLTKISQDELNNLNEESTKIIDNELPKLIKLTTLTERETLSKKDRIRAIKEIQQQYPNYLKNQDLEKVSLEQIKQANDELTESLLKKARAQAALDALTKLAKEQIEDELSLTQTQINQQKELAEFEKQGPTPSQLEGFKKAQQELLNAVQTNINKNKELRDERRKAIEQFITDNKLEGSLIGDTGSKIKEVREDELTQLQQLVNKRKDVLAGTLKLLEQERREKSLGVKDEEKLAKITEEAEKNKTAAILLAYEEIGDIIENEYKDINTIVDENGKIDKKRTKELAEFKKKTAEEVQTVQKDSLLDFAEFEQKILGEAYDRSLKIYDKQFKDIQEFYEEFINNNKQLYAFDTSNLADAVEQRKKINKKSFEDQQKDIIDAYTRRKLLSLNEIKDLTENYEKQYNLAEGNVKEQERLTEEYGDAISKINQNIVDDTTETAAKLVDIDKQQLQQRRDFTAQTLQEIGDLYSNFIDTELQLTSQRTNRIIEQLERERQAKLKQLELESKDVITQSDIRQAQVDKINEEYDKRQRDLEAKQFDYEKQLKTSQTIINGIVGASQIVASQAANPVLMGISLAALAATTAGQVAVIQDQKLPEYAIGGMVEGPGTGTSDSILARLSNGEFVVNAKATQQYLPVLKAINEGKTDNTMFDTSRLESVLSRLENKMSEPSKAYIVQNDLYNSVRSQQQLNNRRKL